MENTQDYAKTVKEIKLYLIKNKNTIYIKKRMLKMKKRIKVETPIWKCANGHWGRVEYLDADGLWIPVKCPICGNEMSLDYKKLPEMMKGYPTDYTISYNTEHRKGKRNG